MDICQTTFSLSISSKSPFIVIQASSNKLTRKDLVNNMGTGYKGNADYYHKISENLDAMKSSYDYHNGLFGTKGQSKSNSIRNIASDNPTQTAKDFYDQLCYGGKETALYNKDGSTKGFQVKMADGTIVNWRVKSTSDGSPAVDIDVQYSTDHGDLVTQKIHFVKEK